MRYIENVVKQQVVKIQFWEVSWIRDEVFRVISVQVIIEYKGMNEMFERESEE